ncbi:MBL fold metallo-hydrolase [Vallitalea okinawensis]|uniref:MBL fold metallo-hydrolase n=1 Tax=Vallitalea okinawensis TaxID=2078660 RepID=UPI0013002BDD|nr:MBL fold metallo-hydrolase [Vallitalea okinawensis]
MLKKLTNNVFYMPQSSETDRPALGLICGEKYSLIVDSGTSPNHAKDFLAELGTLKISPIKYLAITHWHWDHIFGIKEMNLITVAHHHTAKRMEMIKEYRWDDESLEQYVREGIFTEFTVECLKKEIPERQLFTIGDLDITFKDSIEIDLGGITCILKHIGGDHTEDSSIIYVPDEKVIFLGDCIYGGKYNGEYGYTKEKLFRMIDEIEEFEADHYIISHEEVYGKKDIDELWQHLRTAGEVVGEATSVEKSITIFEDTLNRRPSEDEVFYINCFINVNKALKKK